MAKHDNTKDQKNGQVREQEKPASTEDTEELAITKSTEKSTEETQKKNFSGSEGASVQSVIAEWEDKYKRALADYHNLVKRAQDEKMDWGRFANKELLLRFLPVFDTLMLAAKHSEDQTLKVTAQQFLDVLRAEGVERIKTEGKEFDPHLMEVIDIIEGGAGKVIEEVRAGYLLHDKLLRVAQVRVGRSA